jgi:hypothetical protein
MIKTTAKIRRSGFLLMCCLSRISRAQAAVLQIKEVYDRLGIERLGRWAETEATIVMPVS